MDSGWAEYTISRANLLSYIHCLAGRKRVLFLLILSLSSAGGAFYAGARHWHSWGYGLAAALIALAGYLAWADERNRFVKVCRYISQPDIACTIHACHACESGGVTYLIVDTDVTNRSLAPTTLKAASVEVVTEWKTWSAHIRSADRSEAAARVIGLTSAQLRDRAFADLLTDISSSPLQNGRHRTGSFVFSFSGLQGLPNAILLRLALEDAYGNSHPGESRLRGGNGHWSR